MCVLNEEARDVTSTCFDGISFNVACISIQPIQLLYSELVTLSWITATDIHNCHDKWIGLSTRITYIIDYSGEIRFAVEIRHY